MVEFPSNIPLHGNIQPGPVQGSDNPYDLVSAFVQATDTAWEAINLLKSTTPPNDTMTQTVMTSVTDLYKYLTANPPPAGSYGANILASLEAGAPTLSILSLCSNPSNIGFIGSNPDVFDAIMGNTEMNGIGSNRLNNGNATIKQDITTLQNVLKAYNTDPVDEVNAVANCICKLESDVAMANPPITDGYLNTLLTYLNSPIQAGGTDTLQSLSLALHDNPSSQTAIDALNSALTGLGENVSGGGSFTNVIDDVFNWEYNH